MSLSLESAWLAAWQAAWIATPLLVLVLVTCAVLRRASPALRHALLLAGLTATLLLALVPRGVTPAILVVPAPFPAVPPTELPVGAEQHPNPVGTAARQAATGASAPATRSGGADWLARAWALGSLLLLTDLALGWVGLERLRRRSVPGPRPGVQIGGDRGPSTFGVWRPVILLPLESRGWDAERLDSVLAHERAHVDRGDWWTQAFGRVVRALFWFHPLVWYVVLRKEREAEQACDRIVLSHGVRPSRYAALLLDAALHGAPRAGVAMARRGQVHRRIRAVLDLPIAAERPRLRRAAAAAVLGLVVPANGVQVSTTAAGLEAPLPVAQARWSGGGYTAALFVRGAVRIRDGDTDLETLTRGGAFALVTRNDSTGTLRSLHAAVDSDERAWRSYAVDGHATPFDDEARSWLAAILPQARHRLRGPATHGLLRGGREDELGPWAERLAGSTQTGTQAMTRDGGRTVAGRVPSGDGESLFFFKGGDVQLGGDGVRSVSPDGWLFAVDEGQCTVATLTLPRPGGPPRTTTWRDGVPVPLDPETHAAILGRLNEVEWLRTPRSP